MIEFCYETDFSLADEGKYSRWIQEVIKGENSSLQGIVYIFCDDERMLELNKKYLNHDTYTDILTFPYSEGNNLLADIFISVPRVMDNAENLKVNEQEELRRVMIHGVLHLLGYDDHGEENKSRMRQVEDDKLKMFHVEQ